MRRTIMAGAIALAILALNQATAMACELQLQSQNPFRAGLLGVVAPSSKSTQTFAQIPQATSWLISDPSRTLSTGMLLGTIIFVVFPRALRRSTSVTTRTVNQALQKPTSQATTGKASRGFSSVDLRAFKLFESFEEPQLETFCRYVDVMKCPQFSHLIRKGERGEAMYLVLEGEVRALTIIEGKESVPTTFPAGQWFGEISVLDRGPREVDFVANKDSVLLRLSMESFERMRREEHLLASQFVLGLACVMAGRMRCSLKRVEAAISFISTSGMIDSNQEPESRSNLLSYGYRSDGPRSACTARGGRRWPLLLRPATPAA